ncbi:hypothetical protein AQPE_4824 [Aquipluma nitroreducens]|uniref:Uncharacterized protein n=1 Tax=Aquipluma nitroreducens TaxID=2010828 RepID=A0A5K7SG99_9BACT|nr:hypothetical protein AQPE_4824 [Aquipluma nitroreducens]
MNPPNRRRDRISSPIVCQNVISGKWKSNGISQFHKYMVINPKAKKATSIRGIKRYHLFLNIVFIFYFF